MYMVLFPLLITEAIDSYAKAKCGLYEPDTLS